MPPPKNWLMRRSNVGTETIVANDFFANRLIHGIIADTESSWAGRV
jgi:hypothetical protein